MDYTPVSDALSAGADPAMLCQTCPWDRNCITPPTMTKADVDAKIAEAQRQDDERDPEKKSMPIGALLTVLTLGCRDSQAAICPVFALRLRSGNGRAIAETLKTQMQSWDDQS